MKVKRSHGVSDHSLHLTRTKLEMKVPIAKLEILKQFVDCAGNNSTSEPKPPKSLGYGLFNEFRLKSEIV